MADSKMSKAQLKDALRASQNQLAALQADVLAKSEAEAPLKITEEALSEIREALAEETAKLQETGKKLTAQQAQYKAFLEHSAEGIWRLDCVESIPTNLSPDEQIELFYQYGQMGECNLAMAKMYGFASVIDLIGTRLGDFLVKADPQNIEMLRAFIHSGYQLSDY